MTKQTRPKTVIIKGPLPGEKVDLFYKLTGELPSKKNIEKQKLLDKAISKTRQATIEETKDRINTDKSLEKEFLSWLKIRFPKDNIWKEDYGDIAIILIGFLDKLKKG